MNFETMTAQIIIDQKNCSKPITLLCFSCPALKNIGNYKKCCVRFMPESEMVNWFKNWLKEHTKDESNMSE